MRWSAQCPLSALELRKISRFAGTGYESAITDILVDVVRICSWNIAHQSEPWLSLVDSDFQVALLQEAAAPPPEVRDAISARDTPWMMPAKFKKRHWRSAVVGLDPAVELDWPPLASFEAAGPSDVPVSRPGSLDFALLQLPDEDPIVLASMYGVWDRPVGHDPKSNYIFADASVHRIVSDICFFVASKTRHRIIAAGDLNIFRGYGDRGEEHWRRRYQSVFDRFEAIGIPFVGPQLPNGQAASTSQPFVPDDTANVPTFRRRKSNPGSALDQLDFVFASASIRERISVRALNSDEDWGPSDHCRIEIVFD